MKLSIATLSALSFFLLGSTTANFDVYQDDEYNGLGKSGFLVFNNDPSCENVLKAPFFDNRPDVSGNKKGVRQYIKDGVSISLPILLAPPLTSPPIPSHNSGRVVGGS
jgi:hypothetical protein